MKITQAAILTGFVATTIASPTNGGYTVRRVADIVDGDLAPMTFVGQALVDGPNVTLSGTAETIYAQLLAINPFYEPWDFPNYQERMGGLGLSRDSGPESIALALSSSKDGLRKRDSRNCDPAGAEVGNLNTQCFEGYYYLVRLNGYCGVPAGPGGCARVSCSTNCGISACNDNRFDINVWCGNIAGDALDIRNECGNVWDDTWGWVEVKGQVFRDGPPSWNTIVKEHNC